MVWNSPSLAVMLNCPFNSHAQLISMNFPRICYANYPGSAALYMLYGRKGKVYKKIAQTRLHMFSIVYKMNFDIYCRTILTCVH